VLNENGQVCGEIIKTFIFVWNRSGWAASKVFIYRCQNSRPTWPTGRKAATAVWKAVAPQKSKNADGAL